jgi:hypothetical protein
LDRRKRGGKPTDQTARPALALIAMAGPAFAGATNPANYAFLFRHSHENSDRIYYIPQTK